MNFVRTNRFLTATVKVGASQMFMNQKIARSRRSITPFSKEMLNYADSIKAIEGQTLKVRRIANKQIELLYKIPKPVNITSIVLDLNLVTDITTFNLKPHSQETPQCPK